MAGTDLVKKLCLKPQQMAAVLYSPPGFPASLGPLPEGVQVEDESGVDRMADGAGDFVLLFVGSVANVAERAPKALRVLKYDGLFWAAYPKQSSKVKTDINRDKGWGALAAAGLRPVTQIALDDTWSALRFRPAAKVGT